MTTYRCPTCHAHPLPLEVSLGAAQCPLCDTRWFVPELLPPRVGQRPGELSQLPVEVVGDYRLVERLGASSIGQAYKGFRTGTAPEERAFLLIHFLHLAYSDRPGFIGGLQRQLVKFHSLDGGQFATLHDVGDTGHAVYLVTDYVTGTSLDALLRTPERVPQPRRITIARTIIDSLCAAHEAGIVLGGLAPQDLIVATNGEIRLTQYGQYGLTRQDAGLLELLPASGLFGRANFDAPELLNTTHPATTASDVFSAAACVRFALTGRIPTSADALLPLQGFPQGLDALLAEMGHPAPDQRPTMRRVLARWDGLPWGEQQLSSSPIRRRVTTPTAPTNRRWLAVVAVIMAFVLLVLWWRPWQLRGELEADEAELVLLAPLAVVKPTAAPKPGPPAARFPTLKPANRELFPGAD